MDNIPNLIVMLTHHDRTVPNAAEIFEACSHSRAKYWGFKEVGLPLEQTGTICAAILSVVCFMAGLCASYLLDTPTGASVVVANIAAFLVFWLVGRIREKG